MPYKVNSKKELEEFIIHHWDELNTWIDKSQQKLPQPLTSSVDIRESKYKYAPVDHNMYPAGFNNLCRKDIKTCSFYFSNFFQSLSPAPQRVGLFPESHTKNKFYLDHLYFLKTAIEKSGVEVVLFSSDTHLFDDGQDQLALESFSGFELLIHRAEFRHDEFVIFENHNQIHLDFIVLNNDQSSPINVDWKNLKTPIHPSPYVGWFQRQKIQHFKHYHQTLEKFCESFSINPDLLEAKFSFVHNVDFSTKEGLDKLASEVDSLLTQLPEESNVFIKASQGTYGMGISVVSSGEEVIAMNRKVRNKMNIGKGNIKFKSLLIQEGVETVVRYDDAPSEVTIYLINGRSAGGFVRSNPLRTTKTNLNAQGMVYRKLCLSDVKQDCDHTIKEAVYAIIARLSVLSASYELKELMENL